MHCFHIQGQRVSQAGKVARKAAPWFLFIADFLPALLLFDLEDGDGYLRPAG
jgi:hypothetical protein